MNIYYKGMNWDTNIIELPSLSFSDIRTQFLGDQKTNTLSLVSETEPKLTTARKNAKN